MGDGGVDRGRTIDIRVVEPYNYTPYTGLSTQYIGQIPHHSPWGRWGLPLISALGKAIFLGRVGLDYWVLTIIR